MRKKAALIWVLLLLPVVACAGSGEVVLGPVSARIDEVGARALQSPHYVRKDGVITLYGTRTNGPDTRDGDLACAKVASIVLKEAGVMKRTVLGVRQVEHALRKWKKVHHKENLQPGDVVVWTSRIRGRKDKQCTGGGNCHVGIATSRGILHNSPISNRPVYNGVGLWFLDFKVAFRAP